MGTMVAYIADKDIKHVSCRTLQWIQIGLEQLFIPVYNDHLMGYFSSGAHLGGQGPTRWAPEGRNC